MASKKYGYMATIGADTSGLRTALVDLENEARNISNELRSVNEGLRLDGGNGSAENLARRYDLLQEAIRNTQARLDALRQSEEAVNRAAENGTITVEQQRQHQQAIRNTESQLRTYQQQLSNTNTRMQNLGDSTEEASQDTTQLGNQMQNAGRQAANFGDILKANVIGDIITNGIRRVCSELEELTKKSIELASNLTEVQNVVDTTFGNDAAEINRWSQSASGAFGLSELAAKKYTGTLGAMLKSQGITNDKIVEMSEGLVGLAGDMASFYNLDIETAFTKIRSGISGEIEPLKQLGININVANMEAYALANGIETSWKKMSQSEQTQLRYNYLLQQTADAQGDFIRTQDSYANQQRLMQLNMENLEAELGKKLLPIINQITTEITSGLPSLMSNIEDIGNVLATVTEFVVDNKEAFLSAAAAVGAYSTAVKIGTAIDKVRLAFIPLTVATEGATAAQYGLNTAMNLNPAVLIISAIVALGAAVATYAIQLDAATNSEKEIKKATDEIISSHETEARIIELKAQRYRDLYDEYKKTGEASNELKQLAEELQELSPGTISLIDTETGAYKELGSAIDDVTESIRLKALEEAKAKASGAYYENISEYASKIGDAQVEFNNAMMEAGISAEELAEFEKENYGKYADYAKEIFDLDYVPDDYYEINAKLYAYREAALDRDTELEKYNAKIEEELKKAEASNAVYDQIIKDFEDKNKKPVKYGDSYDPALAEQVKIQDKANEERLEKAKQFADDLNDIQTRYDQYKIINNKGEKDEAAYYAEQKKLVEDFTGEKTDTYYKCYDDIMKYEKKVADEEAKQVEKNAKDAETAAKERADAAKKRADAEKKIIKDKWDEIGKLQKRGKIDEEAEYKLKYIMLTDFCENNKDEYADYYDWCADYIANREKELTEEQVEQWENASEAITDDLSKRYEEIAKRKKKLYDDLTNIDLTSTVKGKDGKDITVLNDLNAEMKKVQQLNSSIEKLRASGADDNLINKIMGMNYENGDRQRFIDTLLGLSQHDLQLYYADWAKLQAEQERAAQSMINDDVDALNKETVSAVDKIYNDAIDIAYEKGVETAENWMKGIGDAMSGVNSEADISAILSADRIKNGSTTASTQASTEKTVAASTPVYINLNDKNFITTTIGKLITGNKLTGKNNFNL